MSENIDKIALGGGIMVLSFWGIGQKNQKCYIKTKHMGDMHRWEMEQRQMIDVHAHVLPGVDDGARDFGETLRLLRFAVDQGFEAVIATPHYSRRNEAVGLKELADQVQQEIRKEYPDFTLYLGQETFFHEELPQRLKDGKAYTMAGSRYVLVEFEPEVSYERLFRGIRALSFAGYRPVLAHMERYGCLRIENHLQELRDIRCVLQMNYESLQGSWPHPEARWCKRQVREGRIELLGTDMHRPDYRPPKVRNAVRWLEKNVRSELVTAMTYANPLHIIKDEGMEQGR